MSTTGVAQQAATILERSVCLVLTVHYLGNNRKIRTEKVVKAAGGDMSGEVDGREKIDAQQLSTTKRLVDTKVLNPAMREISRAKRFLRSQGIASHHVFGERSYLIPIALVTKVDAALSEYAENLRTEARIVAAKYTAATEAQRQALGPLFDPSEYPKQEDVEGAFSIDWNYVGFNSPERLETVDRAIAEASRRKTEARMADAYKEVRLALRVMFQETVAAIVDKLTPGPDNKAKVIRGTVLKDLADFLEMLPMRNMADDTDADRLAGRLRQIIAGVDPARLREEDGDARERVRANLASALQELDGMVTTARRAISFRGLSDVA